jgi:hypothetical protein
MLLAKKALKQTEPEAGAGVGIGIKGCGLDRRPAAAALGLGAHSPERAATATDETRDKPGAWRLAQAAAPIADGPPM